jgi:acyl-coenzyme A synthetase/AMP-(fatty) acid ligase
LANGQQPSDNFAQSLRDMLRSHLAPFKIPHKIEFAQSLPKSAVGKILRTALGSQNSK